MCPTCGKWGSIQKHRKNTLCMRHRDDKRCAITWHRKFYIFAMNVHDTVCRTTLLRMRQDIRRGNYIIKGYNYLDKVTFNKSPKTKNNDVRSDNELLVSQVHS
jgi:hypothetical protein